MLPSLHFDSVLILSTAVAGDATNIILDPLFIFVFRMGISGAAIAHVISQ
jgi:Na+-driven multidrug efflux pump